MILDSKLYYKKNKSTTFLNEELINIYKTRYKYFKYDIIYIQNWRVRELLKYIVSLQTKINEPTVSYYKSDRAYVNILDTWKTEISKHK